MSFSSTANEFQFPRARVFMDQYSLKVSEECATELAALEKLEVPENGEITPEDADVAEAQLRRFSERYGESKRYESRLY